MFKKIKTNENAQVSGDIVYGANKTLPSDIYIATISKAYAQESKHGALGIVLEFLVPHNEQNVPFTQTFYVTNKDGENFYTVKEGKNAGQTRVLPAYTHIKELCGILLGMGIEDVSTEPRTFQIYGQTQTVEAIPDLMGQEIGIALKQIRTNATAENPMTGKYEATPEEKIINEIQKFLAIDGDNFYTYTEASEQAEPEFAVTWLETHQGKMQNKYVEVSGAASTGQKAAIKPRTSLASRKG